MTAMANQTTAALESLKFYAVTKSWFVRAWPILTAKPNEPFKDDIGGDLRQKIGKIQNSEIVLVEEERQTSLEDADKGKVVPTDENATQMGNPSQWH